MSHQTFVLRYVEPETFQGDECTLTLTHHYKGRHGRSALNIEESKSLALDFSEGISLDVAVSQTVHLESLLTFASQSTSLVQTLDLTLDLESTPEVQFWRRRLTNGPPRKETDWQEMFFSHRDIGGLSGVARWLTWADAHPSVVKLMASVHDSGVRYVENRLTNVTTAAEVYHETFASKSPIPRGEYRSLRKSLVEHAPEEHRDWLREMLLYGNKWSMRTRLEDLYEHAGEAFTGFITDGPGLADRVTSLRNGVVHTGASDPESDPWNVNGLAVATQMLLMWCALVDMGLAPEELKRISDSTFARMWRSKHPEW